MLQHSKESVSSVGQQWTFLATACGLGTFIGCARLLAQWDENESRFHQVGDVMLSIAASVLIGLYLWEPLFQHPTTLMAVMGSGGWYGPEFPRLASMILRWRFNGNGKS